MQDACKLGQDRMHALAGCGLAHESEQGGPGLQRRQRQWAFTHSLVFHNQGLDNNYRALLLVEAAKVSKQILPWVDHFCMTPPGMM